MARAPRRGFPQENKQKAGIKGGSGAAWAAGEILPVDWTKGEAAQQPDPDQFGVQRAEAREQDAEEVNGSYSGTKSGALTFPPAKE